MMWTILFVFAALVQIFYWSVLFVGLRRAKEKQPVPKASNDLPSLSVIVAARNEKARLPTLLKALRSQTHPSFEVIVVDDDSVDQTADVVLAAQEEDARVRLVQLTDNAPPRKKRALTQGIAAAKHNLLALTDADCVPCRTWLEELARGHQSSREPCILVGYSPYRQNTTFREKLASFETFVTGIFTAAAASLGKSYMAVGRNISYPRSIFEKIGGFDHSMNSLSGDDDLFVQEARRHGYSALPLLSPRSFVATDAPSSWQTWLRQKRRHASAGRFYDREMQFHLTTFHATDLICWLAPLFLGWMGFAVLGSKLLFHGGTLIHGGALFQEQRLLWWAPILAPAFAIYVTAVEPFGVALLPEKWK